MATPQDFDVAICGGGLVGATLAIALDRVGLAVALIESHPFGVKDQPSFDERTTALSNGSRRIFQGLDVWPLIEHSATPIRKIHVSDKGRFGFARIDAADQGLNELGHVVVNRDMGAALWDCLQRTSVRVFAPARMVALALEGDRRRVDLTADASLSLTARLVVAADGAQSTTREAAGVSAAAWDYEQTAIVTNVATQRFHDYVAYERFTPTGPIALLPMSDGRCGVIWTVKPAEASAITALADADFLARLQESFGFRLGRLTRAGKRQTYPLALTRSDAHAADRLAIIGNAAQSLHPIAGQGFNLGLRDVASLAEVLADARQNVAAAFDAGDGLVLQRFQAWRDDDRKQIVRFTDGLVRLFMQPFGPVKLLRDMGLLAFDLLPPAKAAMAQLSLGAAGRIPRLARGAPLVSPAR